jgi:cellulose synthase/poly-beta-1,6-N-acetylglucosamine synthase-like glycosyltransferase
MLSMLPTLEMKGIWENIIQPVCSGVMMIWFDPDRVNNPNEPDSYANGAFMLIRRDAYEQIGGHGALADCLQEDLELGRRIKARGLTLTVPRSEGLYVVRMYTSLRAILAGWTRIFYGSFATKGRLLASMLLLLLMGALPYVAASVGLPLGAARNGAGVWWWTCGLVGAAAVAIQFSVLFRFYRMMSGRGWLCWTYPLGMTIVFGILLHAMAKHLPGAKLKWKNTTYSR